MQARSRSAATTASDPAQHPFHLRRAMERVSVVVVAAAAAAAGAK